MRSYLLCFLLGFSIVGFSQPAITSFTPTSAGTGSSITITGSNLTTTNAISLGGTAVASFTVLSSTSIIAVVGSGTSGSLSVTTTGGTAQLAGFTYLSSSPPTITSFTPTSATTGDAITVTGSNFSGTTSVSLDGTAVASFSVLSSTTLTAVVGTGSSGTLSVTTSAGTGGLAGFTYITPAAPTITSFTPTSATNGGTISITGTNLTAATAVSLGGTAVASFNVLSSTNITAVVGSGSTGSLSVTTTGGITSLAGFTYIPPAVPTISSFTPTSAASGATITITGTNLSTTTAVSIGGVAVSSFHIYSSTSVTATVGAGASGSLSVTTTGGSAQLAGFTYISSSPPTITSFTPTSATTGATITVTGTNLTGTTAVSLGGTAVASFNVLSSTSLTAVVGTGSSGSLSITTSAGTTGLGGFTYISSAPAAPIITSFSPVSAATGGTISITGTDLTTTTAVSLGGTAVASFTVLSSTNITAVVGTGSSGVLSVTTTGGTATLNGFTYNNASAPSITSFTPTAASIGTTISVTGTNFNGITSVALGGTAVASFSVLSPTEMIAVVASGSSGSLSITNAGGLATLGGFTYQYLVPTLSSFTPTSASASSIITVTGTNFIGINEIKIGGTNVASFTVLSSTSLTAVVGTGTSGSVNVSNPGGTGSLAGFVYIDLVPTITSFTPTSASSGQILTITGTNFTGTTNVTIGGTAVASFTVITSTTITAIVGNGSSGNIVVTKNAGSTSASGFTYIAGAPTISSFTPTSATTGATFTVTGINLTGITSVTLGGTAVASFNALSSTTLIATVANGSSGNLSITTSAGTASLGGFTYFSPTSPTISSFSPTNAAAGETITITGTNLSGTTGVTIGGTAVQSFTIISSSTIRANIGSGSTGSVSISSSGGSAMLAGFTFNGPPSISSLLPTSGGTGTLITLTGTGFANITSVLFGNRTTSFHVLSPTTITLTAIEPASVSNAPNVNISVIAIGNSAAINGFTFIYPAPTLTSISPTSAAMGSSITLTGTNFTGVTSVTIGGTAAASFEIKSATTIFAVIGAGASGSISVSSNGGSAALSGFTYIPTYSITTNGVLEACNGDSIIKLPYTAPNGYPPKYSIVWTSTNAISANFPTVTNGTLQHDTIKLSFPNSLFSGGVNSTRVYTGKLNVGDGVYQSVDYPIQITVNPTHSIPDIAGPTTTCLNSSVQFTTTGSGGVWTIVANPLTNANWLTDDFSKASIDTTGKVKGLVQGTVNVMYRVTTNKGCKNFISSQLTIIDSLAIAVIGGTKNITVTNSSTLSSSVAGGVWSSNDTSKATVSKSGIVKGVAPGNAIISYKLSNGSGCTNISTANITVFALPAPVLDTTVQNGYSIIPVNILSFCIGDSLMKLPYTAPKGYPPKYSIVWDELALRSNFTNVTNATLPKDTIRLFNSIALPAPRTYTAVLTVGDETKHSVDYQIQVTVNPSPSIPDIAGPTITCISSSAQFTTTGSGGVWTIVSDPLSNNNWLTDDFSKASINTNGLVTGVALGKVNVMYRVTSDKGCKNFNSSPLTISDSLPVPKVTGDTNIIVNTTRSLSSPTPGGIWSSNDTSKATVSTNGLVKGITSGTAIISYSISNSKGCISIAKATITISADTIVAPPASPLITAAGGTVFCSGQNVILNSSDSIHTIQWFKDGNAITGAQSKKYTVTETGVYTAKAGIKGLYSAASQPVTVTVNPLPNVTKPAINTYLADTLVCFTNSLTLTSQNNYDKYLWSTGETTASITVSANTTVSLKAGTNQSSCYTESSAVVNARKNLAVIPVITKKTDSLIMSSTENAYRWLLNNKILQGDTTNQLKVSVKGVYNVSTSADGFCWNNSVDYVVLFDPVAVKKIFDLVVYPNPTNGIFSLQLKFEKAVTAVIKITITDASGVTKLNTRKLLFSDKTIRIPVNLSLAKGIHTIKVDVNGEINTQQLIVQ